MSLFFARSFDRSEPNLRSIEVMDSESDSDTADIYEVEKILDAKRKEGKVLYKVRWEGYGSEEDSWEPGDNLLTCQDLVDRFWVEKKEGYKKRGRKPKRIKVMTDEDSDVSDTEEGPKDQNNEPEKEMPLPPQKRKRGRPPKHRILSETDSADQDRSTSPELSEENAATKKPRRSNKDDEFSPGFFASEFLLLDYEIAPLGLTRQASKELALVSLRKKQECESFMNSKSENRTTTEGASASVTKQDDVVELKPSDTDNVQTNNVRSEEEDFEVIEISSQSTEDEDQQTSSQESEPVIKEYIVISSQSESDGEGEGEGSSKTKLKKKTKIPAKSQFEDVRNDSSEMAKDSVGLKEGLDKLKKTLPVEDHTKKNTQCLSVETFPPIDFSSESKAAVTEVANDEESSLNTKNIPEVFQIENSKVFNENATDENSNQVTASFLSIDLSSKFSVSKIQSLFKKSMKEKNPIPGVLDNSTKSDSEQKGTDLSETANKNENLAVTSETTKPPSSLSAKQPRNIFESNANLIENNDMENWVMRSSLDMDTSQLCNHGIVTAKRKNEKSLTKGKARRTDGKPKSIRERKRKRLSIEQQNLAASTKSPISENSTGGMNEAPGKPEKQMIASTTADLLPMQNKTSSVPLMDGDLIGAIIQDSGKKDDGKTKPQAVTTTTRKDGKRQENVNTQNKAQDDTEKFKPWDSGMEDISDGEDDLSDFEFDLDDYSPQSFFNDAEDSIVVDRSSSPVVEPLNLSWADLKQAVREGDTMLVRRALAVPGFNPDMIDTASGMTLLMWAATYGQDEIVKLLHRRGAGVNTDENRNAMTALLHAAEQGFSETVQILLESGAHINWQTTAGETALMRACKKGHEEVVGVLLRHGVDTKARTTYELTAEQIALKNQHFEIQNLLSDHEESLANTLQIALGKCLGTAGTLRLPLLMPYRCIAPGEKDSATFPLINNPTKVPQDTKVVVFCVRADFNGDEVCLSFGGDNGVRSVLLNGCSQYPLVQGNRSVYVLTPDTEASSNELTVQTHSVKSARLIVCVGNVSAAAATESS